jgi:hypothetical protein
MAINSNIVSGLRDQDVKPRLFQNIRISDIQCQAREQYVGP